MKKVRISLCMIVRDEEDTLARCLDSAKAHVDEIIILDTGSKDSTVAIAESFGARVEHAEWNDHFAEARNLALSFATGDWVLSLDADEVLSRQAGRELRRVARKAKYVGAYIPLRDQGDERETVSLMFRAWKRRPDIEWRYRLHEQVLPSVNPIIDKEGLRLAQLEGEILHDGYREEVMERKGKNLRNQRLYEAQLSESPDDLYVLYKYADFLRRRPEVGDALPHMERAFSLMETCDKRRLREYTFAGELCGLLALEKLRRDEASEAEAITRFGIDHCRETAHLWYARACALTHLESSDEAERAFKKCQSFHGRTMLVPPQPHITGLAAPKGIIRCKAFRGELDDAIDLAFKLVTANPDDQESLDLWMEVSSHKGDLREITRQLIVQVQAHPESGRSWLAGAEFFFRVRLFDNAKPWILRATALLEDPAPAWALHGECLLAQGQFEESVAAFSQATESLRGQAGLLLMSMAFGVERDPDQDLERPELREELRRMVQNIRILGQEKLSHRLFDAANELEDVDPKAHELLEAALG